MSLFIKKFLVEIVFFVFFILFFVLIVFAASEGFNDPTSLGDVSNWTEPTNAYTSNNSYAVADAGQRQEYDGFGFSIPNGNTIDGIEVRIEWNNPDGKGDETITAQLLNINGVPIGETNTTPVNTSASDVTHTLGGPNIKWGVDWTDTNINDVDFGVSLLENHLGGKPGPANVDNVDIKVYYSEPAQAPDVNVFYPENQETFDRASVSTVDVNIEVKDPDTNAENITAFLNYSTSTSQGTGTVIVANANLATDFSCDSNDLSSPSFCTYPWDISPVPDGNYYILAFVSDPLATNWDFNAGEGNFSICGAVSILLTNDTADLGTLAPGETNTTEGLTNALDLENDGGVDVNVYIYATSSLFTNAPGTSQHYQFKVSNIEPGSFGAASATYTDLPIGEENQVLAISFFDWNDSHDTARTDINVLVPDGEPAGGKVSLVYFVAEAT